MIAVFFPCIIVLTSLSTKGNCSIQGNQLVFEKQLDNNRVYIGKHELSTCTFKQKKQLLVALGQHIIVKQTEVTCSK